MKHQCNRCQPPRLAIIAHGIHWLINPHEQLDTMLTISIDSPAFVNHLITMIHTANLSILNILIRTNSSSTSGLSTRWPYRYPDWPVCFLRSSWCRPVSSATLWITLAGLVRSVLRCVSPRSWKFRCVKMAQFLGPDPTNDIQVWQATPWLLM